MRCKILVCFLLFPLLAAAQFENLSAAMEKTKTGDFASAINLVEMAQEHPATADTALTYVVKQYVLVEKFKQKKKQYYNEGTMLQNYEELRDIREDALTAIDKGRKKDRYLSHATDFKNATIYIAKTFYNDGVDMFEAKRYLNAAANYQLYIDALKTHYPDDVEKRAYFNIGYCYYLEGDYEIAKDMFIQVIMDQYETGDLYYYLGKIYEIEGDKVNALRTVEEGVTKFPNDKELIIYHSNLLSGEGKTKDQIPQLEKAVSLDPSNIDAKLKLATVYEKMAVIESDSKDMYLDKAKEQYRKALDLDSENFLANYNLGIILYNESVELINNQSYDLDILELDKILDNTTDGFKKSLPYVKKANSMEPTNRNTLLALEGIYMNLNNDAKVFEYRRKIDELDAAEAERLQESGKRNRK